MSAYSDLILGTAGLVSYWRLNEASGFAIDAKATNAASVFGGVTRQVAGLLSGDPDTAVRGDGAVGTYINVPHHASLNATDALTFECWVRLETYVSGRVILNRSSEWLYQTTNNAYRWRVVDSGGTTRLCTAANNSIVVGTRQHLVGVFDRANAKMELYVDGVLSGSLAIPTNWGVETVTAPFIMLSQSSGVAGIVGTLDEVAYYTTALTAAQVQAHYQAGSGGGAYFDAATGSIGIAGNSIDNLRRSGGRAGVLSLAGSNIDNWSTPKSYIDTATGLLRLSGSCVDGFYGAQDNYDAPSGRITLSGSSTSTRIKQSPGWASVVRELPPLRLSYDASTPSGRQHRWAADEPNAENVPQSARLSSTMPGGFETMDVTLPRKPGVNYSDMERLTTLRALGPGADVAGEYRLERAPVAAGDQMVISPSAVGWQANLEDNKTVQEIFVDIDLTQFGTAGVQRRLNVLPTYDINDATTVPVQSGEPVLKTALTGPWSRPSLCEAVYRSGGVQIGGIYYSMVGSGNVNFGDANWNIFVHLSTDDTLVSGLDSSADLQVTQAFQGLLNATGKRTAITVQQLYNTAFGADGVEYFLNWPVLAVYGRHGLTKRGVATTTRAQGFYASDIVAYAVSRFAPKLIITSESIQASTFLIQQMAFKERTTAAEIVRQANRFHLRDWAVWEGRVFYYHGRGQRGRRWRARVAPAELSSTGPQVDRLWESIMVAFNDTDGSTKTVGPPGSGADFESTYLKDTDPENPANKLGMPRRDLLTMGTSDFNGAIEVGRRFLDEQKLLDRSGQAKIVGHVYDDRGILHPYWRMRAGDEITFIDASDTSYRRIVRADHDTAARTAQLDLDAPPEGLAALLERLGVAIVHLGL